MLHYKTIERFLPSLMYIWSDRRLKTLIVNSIRIPVLYETMKLSDLQKQCKKKEQRRYSILLQIILKYLKHFKNQGVLCK